MSLSYSKRALFTGIQNYILIIKQPPLGTVYHIPVTFVNNTAEKVFLGRFGSHVITIPRKQLPGSPEATGSMDNIISVSTSYKQSRTGLLGICHTVFSQG